MAAKEQDLHLIQIKINQTATTKEVSSMLVQIITHNHLEQIIISTNKEIIVLINITKIMRQIKTKKIM